MVIIVETTEAEIFPTMRTFEETICLAVLGFTLNLFFAGEGKAIFRDRVDFQI